MSSEDLVSVMVPKRHLSKVYGFVARLDEVTPTSAEASEPQSASVYDEWTPSRIRTAVQESPPAMKHILRALAERPEEWVSTNELAQAITHKPNADWKTVAGTLGAFGRRVKSRYGLEHLPFEGSWDHSANCKLHRMPSEIARQMLQALNNGNGYN